MQEETPKGVYFALLCYRVIFVTRAKQPDQTVETHQIRETKKSISKREMEKDTINMILQGGDKLHTVRLAQRRVYCRPRAMKTLTERIFVLQIIQLRKLI